MSSNTVALLPKHNSAQTLNLFPFCTSQQSSCRHANAFSSRHFTSSTGYLYQKDERTLTANLQNINLLWLPSHLPLSNSASLTANPHPSRNFLLSLILKNEKEAKHWTYKWLKRCDGQSDDRSNYYTAVTYGISSRRHAMFCCICVSFSLNGHT